MRGPCGPRETLSGAYSVIIPEWTVYYNSPLACISFWLHYLVFGVCADAADYKLVSFYVTADEG